MSHHRTEAERLLDLIDIANLAPGDLATVTLARAVLAVDDSITDGITEGIASLASTIDAASDRLADRLSRAVKG